ncbi:MAG: type 1 glutamine amidotransferase [Anaerolineales bacterium]|nr:type 1 glutamine amidotransferase [Anaerolineales bacterium]
MPAPLIGVTTGSTPTSHGDPQIAVPDAYTQAIHLVGGLPYPIPNTLSPAELDELLPLLSGLLFTGGGDLDPGRYAAPPHPLVKGVNPARDATELHLLTRAVERRLPFLGVCRGQQLINVGLGGTLYADIASQFGEQIRHDCFPDFPHDHRAHATRLSGDTHLRAILGPNDIEVNSQHHQAVRDLASGLVASAHAPDGIIEAIELPGHPFGLAVQWHPEHLLADAGMAALFAALIAAARF